MNKAEVREEARRLGLRVAEKPDSQELCFVPDDDYARFVERRGERATRAGDITDMDGRVLGHHDGVHRFTVGQRKGLGLSTGRPLYVVALRPESAQVVVGPIDALEETTLMAAGVNWIAGTPPDGPVRADVQVRHRHVPAAARVEAMHGGRARVTFDVAQRALAPGQAAVFYAGDEVIGGGWIEDEIRN
jgi:tRNA-specific 2-thiouridylase